MTNKAQSNRSSRSNFSYVKYVEFFNPPPPPKIYKPLSGKKVERQHKPQQGTINAINRLCQIRLEAIKNGYSIPTKIGAIQRAETTFKTVQLYMPDLLDNWRDQNYRPEKLE